MSAPDKIGLITGANAGIGKQAAIQLAREGFRVVMACRNRERGEAALADVRAESGSDAVELMIVDLSLQASIRTMASEYLAKYDTLDVLVHNGAYFDIASKQVVKTDEDVEVTWATNHLGPVLMTDLLRPALERAAQGRILIISSKGLMAFPGLKVDLEDPEFASRKFSVQRAYYQSKLAQVAYLLHLAEELEGSSVTVHGVRVTNVKIDTARYPGVSKFMLWVYSIKSMFSISPAEMAQTYTWLATADGAAERNGGYFDGPDRPARPSKNAADPEHRAAIMALTRRYLPLDEG